MCGRFGPVRVVPVWLSRYACGMGKRTSIYLPDDLADALEASPETATAVLRRGLGMEPLDERRLREVARVAAEAVRDDVDAIVGEAVKRALRDAQGGSW